MGNQTFAMSDYGSGSFIDTILIGWRVWKDYVC